MEVEKVKLVDAEKCPELALTETSQFKKRNSTFCELIMVLGVIGVCLLLVNTSFGNGCLFSKLFNKSKPTARPEYESEISVQLQVGPQFDVDTYQVDVEVVEEIIIFTHDEDNENNQKPVLEINNEDKNKQCQVTDDAHRFDCFPENGATVAKCEARGCCWRAATQHYRVKENPVNIPYCFYPVNYPGYNVISTKESGNKKEVDISRPNPSYYPNDVKKLLMEVIMETPTRLRIKITDPATQRWEVDLDKPYPEISSNLNSDDYLYSVDVAQPNSSFAFNVKRNLPGGKTTTLLETTGAFIYADQFIQLSYYLPSSFIYGLGEHRDRLLHSVQWQRFIMWNRDHPPKENLNLYGSHPFYLMMENDGNSHGVFLLNSNAMETILQPAPAITWRALGGVIDMYMFLGPTPDAVIQQYTEVIGHTFMPPYWSLGYHLCRWGYKTADRMIDVVKNMSHYGIPQDTQWSDIDYMYEARDFTTDEENFGNQTAMTDLFHERNLHYVIIVDPAIWMKAEPGTYQPLDLGKKMDIFIKDENGNYVVGKVWPGYTYFPDFTNPKTQEYWTTISKTFYEGVKYDGWWIDMNEVSTFISGSVNGCPKNRFENPPYVPAVLGGTLQSNSLCATAKQYSSMHYNLHNLYGFHESRATYNALKEIRGKRPFFITRSTYPGTGRYGGHWSGDNFSSFSDMYKSIAEILTMNMYGISMVSADICGMAGEASAQLCMRWHQVGAFYTLSRNHNIIRSRVEILTMNIYGISMVSADICGMNGNASAQLCMRWHQIGAFYTLSRNHNINIAHPQDPAAFGPVVAASSRKALLTRYTLLPYLYTLFHKSHTNGSTVLRPLFFEFPHDVLTYSIDNQFMWGSGLLISPVLQEDQTELVVYFPNDVWYDYYTGELITNPGSGKLLHTPLDKINLHVRGGNILPWQFPNTTTVVSRKNKFGLLVALNSTVEAKGDLFWDDGDTLDSAEQGLYNSMSFMADSNGIYSIPGKLGYQDQPMILGNVTVFGVTRSPLAVNINGSPATFSYQTQFKTLYIVDLNATMFQLITIRWTF